MVSQAHDNLLNYTRLGVLREELARRDSGRDGYSIFKQLDTELIRATLESRSAQQITLRR